MYTSVHVYNLDKMQCSFHECSCLSSSFISRPLDAPSVLSKLIIFMFYLFFKKENLSFYGCLGNQLSVAHVVDRHLVSSRYTPSLLQDTLQLIIYHSLGHEIASPVAAASSSESHFSPYLDVLWWKERSDRIARGLD